MVSAGLGAIRTFGLRRTSLTAGRYITLSDILRGIK